METNFNLVAKSIMESIGEEWTPHKVKEEVKKPKKRNLLKKIIKKQPTNRYERLIAERCPELIETDASIQLAALYNKLKREKYDIDNDWMCEHCRTAYNNIIYHLDYYDYRKNYSFEDFLKDEEGSRYYIGENPTEEEYIDFLKEEYKETCGFESHTSLFEGIMEDYDLCGCIASANDCW